MTLIERYLHAVRGFLPASGQDDIIQELSEDIQAQVAEREDALGRPLPEGEIADVLRQFGHPMLLAAKYRPQHQLIGPALFPFYWFALKMALGVALVVHLAIALAMIVGGQPPGRIIGPLAAFPFGPAVTVFGWVTLVFAALQLVLPHVRGIGGWNPQSLPTPKHELVPSRIALVCEILTLTAFFLWWLAVPRFPFLIFGPAANVLELTPAFHSAHVTIAALWFVTVVALWTIVLRRWTKVSFAARMITSGFMLVTAQVLIRAGTLVTLANPAPEWAHAAESVRVANLVIQMTMVVAIVASVWELLRTLWQYHRARATSMRDPG